MSWIKIFLFFTGTLLTIIIQLLTYRELSENKSKFKLYYLLYIILGAILITYNSYINVNIIRAYVSYGIIMFLEYIIFNDKAVKTITYGTVCYISAIVCEIVLDVFLISTNIIDLHTIDDNLFIKYIISILIVLIPYIVYKNKYIKLISLKYIKKIEQTLLPFITILFALIAALMIAFKNISNLSASNYISNIVLLILFAILIITIFYNYYKSEMEIKNTKVLLDFMSDYEKKIDEDRVNRHEMLNNLLVLKSYKDKNSKNFNDTLDDLINIYNKKNIGIKNIYKLPSGLKGILYFKINDVKDKNVIININISKHLSNILENMHNKTYAAVCKIVGITFDNAIEASLKSKEKYITFDIYEEDNKIVIDIENTFKGKVDVDKISNKNYSTKGKNRGLGLYIVEKIIKNNNDINIEWSVDKNVFINKIYINKKSR